MINNIFIINSNHREGIREYRQNGPEANLIEGNIYSEGTDSLRRQ